MRPEAPFDLEGTLASGQIFRYGRLDGGWRIDHGDMGLRVLSEGRTLVVDGAGTKGAARFLAVNECAAEREDRLARDPVLREAIALATGLRILRQDLWECLVSFVLSQVSNIPRIRGCAETLARRWGTPLPGGGRRLPGADEMPEDRELRRTGRVGFRARYLVALSRAWRDGTLGGLDRRSREEARARLLAIEGIGEKVAECVLLFALGHGDSFPVDVRIERIVRARYFGGRRRKPAQIRAWARDRWGALAGYAQQFLYVLAGADRRGGGR